MQPQPVGSEPLRRAEGFFFVSGGVQVRGIWKIQSSETCMPMTLGQSGKRSHLTKIQQHGADKVNFRAHASPLGSNSPSALFRTYILP